MAFSIIVFATLFCHIWAMNRASTSFSVPVIETQTSDQYSCYDYSLDHVELEHLKSIRVDVDRSKVHHVTFSFCENPLTNSSVWTCGHLQGHVCDGYAVNVAGWNSKTLDTGHFEFPSGVTVRYGKKTRLVHLVTQIHFRGEVKDYHEPIVNVTLFPHQNVNPSSLNYQTYMILSSGFIPQNSNTGYFAESACEWKKPPVTAYKFYSHTHHYGFMAEGFLIRNNTWRFIGGELTKNRTRDWSSIPGGPLVIYPGDIIAARCLYINKEDKPVPFGLTDQQEMCNFEVNFGYESRYSKEFKRSFACMSNTQEFSFCKTKALHGFCQ
ncbi:probable peptidylglycine alpha-hydroxylating monooxygenase 1 [Saccostrea cucullata]|uniref:probable peptidylglycine alpha-hydroxylating monooxygenase 1 n=1 Tax=Saccostrea cuccullata TaxID=36930 RepID=UPI002ED124DF